MAPDELPAHGNRWPTDPRKKEGRYINLRRIFADLHPVQALIAVPRQELGEIETIPGNPRNGFAVYSESLFQNGRE